MVINSVTNKKVQFLKKLSLRKYRKQEGMYIVEGENIIKDLPQGIKLHSIYVKESKVEDFDKYQEAFDCPIYVLSDRVFDSVSDTVTPCGILAILPIKNNNKIIELKDNAIVLDSISDSGNLGTIIRTAVAFGYRDIILVNCCDPYSGKAVRSSMGGILRVNIYDANYSDFDSLCHRIYVLNMHGEDIQQATVNHNHLLVVGSEAHGISEYFKKRADKVLSIKMKGDIESLNAGVSAAIGMYVITNKKN